MIIGIGIDLVEVARIGRMVERYGRRFVDRVYTAHEVEACRRRGAAAQEFAARWAAKEALMKAVGTGWRGGVLFRDIENYNLPSGKPMIRLHGRVKKLAQRLGGRRIHVSISHEREYAVAVVILEG